MIEVIFLDIDGVLTDGSVYIDSSGNETKRILFDDIDAIFELKRAGFKIGFITGEDNEFCDYVNRRFSPNFLVKGCKDKLSAFKKLAEENSLDKNLVCYAGDSKKDIGLLNFVGKSFAPSDSSDQVKNAAKQVLKASRGEGVIREMVEHIL
ncbi:MAG: HAD hydrolase family protein [Nitrospina sp.]|nr:HAD hydrolase family protein [Nitrospina sp.]